MREELIALASRVESLTGPDRDVDGAIARALGWADRSGYWWSPEKLVAARKSKRSIWSQGAPDLLPHFTASLDAAMTLVPEGMRQRWIITEDGRAGIQLCWPVDGWPNEMQPLVATPALALAAATLRAQADQSS